MVEPISLEQTCSVTTFSKSCINEVQPDHQGEFLLKESSKYTQDKMLRELSFTNNTDNIS